LSAPEPVRIFPISHPRWSLAVAQVPGGHYRPGVYLRLMVPTQGGNLRPV
jgi:hypothetical protein